MKSYSTCRIVHASWSSKFRSMYSLTATLAEINLRSNSSAKYETSKSPQLTCSKSVSTVLTSIFSTLIILRFVTYSYNNLSIYGRWCQSCINVPFQVVYFFFLILIPCTWSYICSYRSICNFSLVMSTVI